MASILLFIFESVLKSLCYYNYVRRKFPLKKMRQMLGFRRALHFLVCTFTSRVYFRGHIQCQLFETLSLPGCDSIDKSMPCLRDSTRRSSPLDLTTWR